jgi:hypothetical protein
MQEYLSIIYNRVTAKKPNCLCDISNGAAGAAGGEKNRTRGRPGPGVASS